MAAIVESALVAQLVFISCAVIKTGDSRYGDGFGSSMCAWLVTAALLAGKIWGAF